MFSAISSFSISNLVGPSTTLLKLSLIISPQLSIPWKALTSYSIYCSETYTGYSSYSSTLALHSSSEFKTLPYSVPGQKTYFFSLSDFNRVSGTRRKIVTKAPKEIPVKIKCKPG